MAIKIFEYTEISRRIKALTKNKFYSIERNYTRVYGDYLPGAEALELLTARVGVEFSFTGNGVPSGSLQVNFVSDWLNQKTGNLIFEDFSDIFLHRVSFAVYNDTDESTMKIEVQRKEEDYDTQNTVTTAPFYSTGTISTVDGLYQNEWNPQVLITEIMNDVGGEDPTLKDLQSFSLAFQVGGNSIADYSATFFGMLSNGAGDDVLLTWTARPNDFTAYRIYKSTDNGETFTLYATVSDPAQDYYIDIGLTAGNYQYYVVGLLATNVESNKGQIVTVDINLRPTNPSNLAIVAENEEAELTWDPSVDENLQEYILYLDGVEVARTTQTNYTFTGLNNGQSYTFGVQAIDALSATSDTVTIIATVIDTLAPATPTGLGVIAEDEEADLTWNANSEPDLAGYNVYLDGVKHNGAVITGALYTITGLTNGQSYDFQVSAVDDVGNESALSSVVSATVVDTLAPATPTGLSLNAPTGEITATWDANTETDLAGYNVYLDGVKHNTVIITGTSYTMPGLTDGTSYDVQVSAVDDVGNESSLSAIVSATPMAAPDAPTNLQVTVEEILAGWFDDTNSGDFNITNAPEPMRVGQAWYDPATDSFYIVGFYSGAAYQDKAYQYNKSTGVWTLLSSTATSNRSDCLPVKVGDYLYYGCGFSNVGTINRINVNTGSLTLHYNLNGSQFSASTPAYDKDNDRYFVFGGRQGSTNYKVLAMIENLTTNPSHTILPTFPGVSGYGAGAIYLNGFLYLKDGGGPGNPSTNPNVNWWKLEIATGTYTKLADFPVAVTGCDFYRNGNNIRMGVRNDSVDEYQFYDYDVGADSFSIVPKETKSISSITNPIPATDEADNAWHFGGYNRANSSTVNNVFVRVF